MRPTKPFRIAHLSDLHLTAKDDAARSEPKLFGALQGMNAAFRKIVKASQLQSADLVLITGDVTDRGDIEAWRVFWEAVQDAGLIERVRVLPGNHDLCCLGIRIPGPNARKADLNKAANGLRLGSQPTQLPWAFMPDSRVVIFGLNSCNMGNPLALDNAVGRLSYYDLKAFACLLREHRDVPVKIVALHHSPNIPETKTAKKRGEEPMGAFERLAMQIPQDQRRALMLLCVTHRVRLVVHGHVHVAQNRWISGVRIVGTPATTEPSFSSSGSGTFRYYSYVVQGNGGRVNCSLDSLPTE